MKVIDSANFCDKKVGECLFSNILDIFLLAGEHSGDLLGANLITTLRKESGDNVRITGVGGPKMIELGLQSIIDFNQINIMGFWSVIKRLPTLISLIRKVSDNIIQARPDIVVFIDSPGFNHRVASRVKKYAPEIAMVFLVPPSVWAWKSGRASKMKKYIEFCLCLLPFEPEVMRKLGGPKCYFVGHPIYSLQRGGYLDKLNKVKPDDCKKHILLLPGSRDKEILDSLDIYKKLTKSLALIYKKTFKITILSLPDKFKMIEEYIANWQNKPEIVYTDKDRLLAIKSAKVALTVSGTMTLELAAAMVPMIVIYKLSFFQNLIKYFLLKIPYISLPNIIAGEDIVPEFVSDNISHYAILNKLTELIEKEKVRGHQIRGFRNVYNLMRPFKVKEDASQLSANILLKYFKEELNPEV